MMKKIFDGFLDQANSGIMDIAAALGVAPTVFLPVRLVSHDFQCH